MILVTPSRCMAISIRGPVPTTTCDCSAGADRCVDGKGRGIENDAEVLHHVLKHFAQEAPCQLPTALLRALPAAFKKFSRDAP